MAVSETSMAVTLKPAWAKAMACRPSPHPRSKIIRLCLRGVSADQLKHFRGRDFPPLPVLRIAPKFIPDLHILYAYKKSIGSA
jgi:hypothetical protein